MIHSTIRWLRSRERRWPIPMRGLLLFGLMLAVVAGWMVWRTIDDNRMDRRFLNAELSASKRGSDYIVVSIDCHWLPRPIRGWLDRRNLVLFPRSDDHVLVSDEFDLEVVRWVVSLPGCQDVRSLD